MRIQYVTPLTDTILYSVVTAPGGVDGMDSTAVGGEVVFASFDKEAAAKHAGQDSRLTVTKSVVDQSDIDGALAKLDTTERYLLQQYFARRPEVISRTPEHFAR